MSFMVLTQSELPGMSEGVFVDLKNSVFLFACWSLCWSASYYFLCLIDAVLSVKVQHSLTPGARTNLQTRRTTTKDFLELKSVGILDLRRHIFHALIPSTSTRIEITGWKHAIKGFSVYLYNGSRHNGSMIQSCLYIRNKRSMDTKSIMYFLGYKSSCNINCNPKFDLLGGTIYCTHHFSVFLSCFILL